MYKHLMIEISTLRNTGGSHWCTIILACVVVATSCLHSSPFSHTTQNLYASSTSSRLQRLTTGYLCILLYMYKHLMIEISTLRNTGGSHWCTIILACVVVATSCLHSSLFSHTTRNLYACCITVSIKCCCCCNMSFCMLMLFLSLHLAERHGCSFNERLTLVVPIRLRSISDQQP